MGRSCQHEKSDDRQSYNKPSWRGHDCQYQSSSPEVFEIANFHLDQWGYNGQLPGSKAVNFSNGQIKGYLRIQGEMQKFAAIFMATKTGTLDQAMMFFWHG